MDNSADLFTNVAGDIFCQTGFLLKGAGTYLAKSQNIWYFQILIHQQILPRHHFGFRIVVYSQDDRFISK